MEKNTINKYKNHKIRLNICKFTHINDNFPGKLQAAAVLTFNIKKIYS